MKFLKIFAAVLALSYLFVLMGGWQLFDFRNNIWVAIGVCAFILAVLISVYVSQQTKIEALEERVKALEESNGGTD